MDLLISQRFSQGIDIIGIFLRGIAGEIHLLAPPKFSTTAHPFPRKTQHLSARTRLIERKRPVFKAVQARMRQSGPSLIQCDDVSDLSQSHEPGQVPSQTINARSARSPLQKHQRWTRIMCGTSEPDEGEFDGVALRVASFFGHNESSKLSSNTLLFAPRSKQVGLEYGRDNQKFLTIRFFFHRFPPATWFELMRSIRKKRRSEASWTLRKRSRSDVAVGIDSLSSVI